MKTLMLLIMLSMVSMAIAEPNPAANPAPSPDLAVHFQSHQATGTIVVVDERTLEPVLYVHDTARASQRRSPASTFKIPHALFALDAGIVRDEFQVFEWDGTERWLPAWNQDQDLRSSMRNSCVWVYQRFAGQIGTEREEQYMRSIEYGNADASGGEDGFWIDGRLEISAREQVAFLRRLYRNELPFSVEHQRLVKDIMIVEAGRDWILRAKTGWEGSHGWWVGWVERPEGAVFFALNIDTPNRMEDLHKREAVTRGILQAIDALPAN